MSFKMSALGRYLPIALFANSNILFAKSNCFFSRSSLENEDDSGGYKGISVNEPIPTIFDFKFFSLVTPSSELKSTSLIISISFLNKSETSLMLHKSSRLVISINVSNIFSLMLFSILLCPIRKYIINHYKWFRHITYQNVRFGSKADSF